LGQQRTIRSQHRDSRENYPELRAYHPLMDDIELDAFFGELQRELPGIIPPSAEVGRHERTVSRPNFRLYSDPEGSGITIVERRLTRRHAKKNRVRWNANDVGRVSGEIQNEIGRLELADRPLAVEFNQVVRLGDLDRDNKNARKLGLIVDQETPEAEFLVREHELAMKALAGNLRAFKYPYSTFIPHFTFGKVFKTVPEQQIGRAIGFINEQLPITVNIEPIKFSMSQEVDTGEEELDELDPDYDDVIEELSEPRD
jgi:hypothetical protein